MDHVPQRLSFVTLGTRDMRRVRSFYETWGWVERGGSTDEFASLDVGSTRLALYPLDLLSHEAAPGCSPPDSDWNGITLAINVDRRILVDEVFAAATASGAP